MTMLLVERIELSSPASSINFASIPQDGTDLMIKVSARGTTTNGTDGFTLEPNGSVPSSMTVNQLIGGPSRTNLNVATVTNSLVAGYCNPSNSEAGTFANSLITIADYTSSVEKTMLVDTGSEGNFDGPYLSISNATFASTAPITSLRLNAAALFGGSFAAGTSATLYKIVKGSVPLSQPKATGGSISFRGGFWLHTFTSSGTFTPNQAISGAQVLIVAGGGGSSQAFAGGGGAGGVLTGSSISFNANTNYAVAVGGGGAGTNGNRMPGTNGSNSSLGTATAIGGGASGASGDNAYIAPSSGGSGGGGGGDFRATGSFKPGGASNQTAPSGYTAYGNAGGQGIYTSGGYGRGGGGGGAGQVGGDTLSTGTGAVNGGLGGNGILSSITGVATYYGGGGGGATDGGGTAPGAIGGLGGGGKGHDGNSPGTAGTANTGGGGGGSGNSSIAPGRAGGSGIVIIRYAA